MIQSEMDWNGHKTNRGLSKLNFSCLCCLIENTELRKLDVTTGYCPKPNVLYCISFCYKQIALLQFRNSLSSLCA